MPSSINESIKSQVIQKWLQGLTRDSIAQQFGISTGAVSNVVEQWRKNFGC